MLRRENMEATADLPMPMLPVKPRTKREEEEVEERGREERAPEVVEEEGAAAASIAEASSLSLPSAPSDPIFMDFSRDLE